MDNGEVSASLYISYCSRHKTCELNGTWITVSLGIIAQLVGVVNIQRDSTVGCFVDQTGVLNDGLGGNGVLIAGLKNLFLVACCIQALAGVNAIVIRAGYYYMNSLIFLSLIS